MCLINFNFIFLLPLHTLLPNHKNIQMMNTPKNTNLNKKTSNPELLNHFKLINTNYQVQGFINHVSINIFFYVVF